VRGGYRRLGRRLAIFALRSLRVEPLGFAALWLPGFVRVRYFESVEPAQLYGYVFVDGAGVRLLLDYA